MAYSKQTWTNSPSTTTPLSAGRLTHIEDGIGDLDTGKQPLDADLTALAALTNPATKLSGIAAGATVNDTDANLKNRANHTGTQTASTISDLTETVQDTLNTTIVAGTNVTTSYNDTAGTLTIASTASGGGTPTLDGVVQLDSFAGANDDAKLTAAMTYAAAQTFKPAIQFPARSVTLNTGGRTPYNGMKLIGPFGADGPKNPEVSSSLVNHLVHVNVGTGTSSLFHGTADVYDVQVRDLCFQDDAGTSQFWSQPSTTLYSCLFHSLTFYGFKHVFGNPAAKCLMTQVMFTGHWTLQAFRDTQMLIGGSDNCFWADAICNCESHQTVGAGVYYLMFDGLQKTKIGYIYATAGTGWRIMQLSGSTAGASGTNFFGGTYEGTTSAPATVPLINVTGGQYGFFGTMFNHVNSSGNNGAILQTGGDISFYTPTYTRYSGTAATWPLLYQTGGAARIVGANATVSGEAVRVRWSDATTDVLAPVNKTVIASAVVRIAPSGDTTGAADHAAITAAIGSGNVHVVLAPGDFYVNASIILQNRTWLDGAGMYATRIRLANTVNQSVIKNYVSPNGVIANAEFCKISNLAVNGNKTAQTAGHGIDFTTNPTGATAATNDDDFDAHQYFENVRITNCKQTGFIADGRSSSVLYNVWSDHNDSYGFRPSVDMVLTNCVASWNGYEGFRTNASSIQLTGCKAFYNGQVSASNGHGFHIYFAVGNTLVGCHAQNNWAHGFSIDTSSSITLSGCVSDSNSMDTPGVGVGLDVWQSTGCEVQITCLDGMGAGNEVQTTALQLRSSSINNSIDLTHSGHGGSVIGAAISGDSVLTGNRVVVNGATVGGSGVDSATHAATSKATPVDADELPLVDSAASNVLKKLTWANLKAVVKTYYDGVASTMTNKTLTDPKINAIKDTSGNNSIVCTAVSSAVNWLELQNAPTGATINLKTVGSDSDIGLVLWPQGNGVASIFDGSFHSIVSKNGSVPSTATSTGKVGQIAADSSWLYICTAADTWRRIAIASW